MWPYRLRGDTRGEARPNRKERRKCLQWHVDSLPRASNFGEDDAYDRNRDDAAWNSTLVQSSAASFTRRELVRSAQQITSARDVLVEQVRQVIPHQPCHAQPMQKRLRREMPGAAIDAALAAEFIPARQPIMTISITDDAANDLMHQLTNEELSSTQAGIGMFFGTGILLDNAQVWKSVPTIHNPPPVYIFKLDTRWFCAGSIWLDQADMHRDEAQRSIMISWSANFTENNPDYPSQPIHMPYWDQKPKNGVSIWLGFDMIMEFESVVNNLMQQFSDRDDASDNDDAPPRAGFSIGPKSQGEGAHGPWFFKCALLIKMYKNRQWRELEHIHTKCMRISSKFREAVNNGKSDMRPWKRGPSPPLNQLEMR